MSGLPDVVGLPLAEARRRLAGAGLSVDAVVTAAPEEAARRRRQQVGERPVAWRVVRAEPGPAPGRVRLLVAAFPLPPVPPEVRAAAGLAEGEGEVAGDGAR